jgi:hypothetical protein
MTDKREARMKSRLVAATFGLSLMFAVATNEVSGASLSGQAGDWYSRGLIRQQTINGQKVKQKRRAHEARQRKKAHRSRKAAIRRHRIL